MAAKPSTSKQNSSSPILQQSCFPIADSKILPNPSKYLSPHLNSSPFPTHAFFQNLILENGDKPVFLHPYFIKVEPNQLSLSYPSVNTSNSSVSQSFSPDFNISSSSSSLSSRHLISSFSDLTVTVDLELSDIRLFLARGSPYITLQLSRPLCLSFSCNSDIKSVSSSLSNTKHMIELQSKQCWIIYSSSELILKKQDNNNLNSMSFVGIIRVAVMPKNDAKNQEILDSYKSCYPTSGEAVFSNPFSMEYKWETQGWGELLMLAHPMHLKLITSIYNSEIRVLKNFKYKSLDGDLVGVVAKSWSLRAPHVPITWHSLRGIAKQFHPEIATSLWKDVTSLDSTALSTTHVLTYGNKIFRAARLALIAEEVNCSDVIPVIRKFLRDAITPWLNNAFSGNGFVYERIWGGIITKQGISNKNADYGFGLYDKFHYFGYFVYAIAVLAKLDPEWAVQFRSQAYALTGSFLNLDRTPKSKCARLRCFDFYKLHSWKGPANGECNSHHSSEHMFTYYAASLLGMAYGDNHLMAVASSIASFEMEASKTWFHAKNGGVYGENYSKENKLVGISTITRREDKLFFAPATHREVRAGMHVLPLLPVTEILYLDIGFVKEIVDWVKPGLGRENASDIWAGFIYALEALYDKQSALRKIKSLKTFNEGHCLSSYLWWVHSRGVRDNFCSWCMQDEKECWYCAYCG